jgi:hypothetical protein
MINYSFQKRHKKMNRINTSLISLIILLMNVHSIYAFFNPSLLSYGLEYNYFRNPNKQKISLHIGKNTENPAMHYLKEHKFNISPAIILQDNRKYDYTIDFKFYETRSLSINTIYQKHIEPTRTSGLSTISYCFYQYGYRLLDIESYGIYKIRGNLFSILYDIVYDRREWGGCVAGHLSRRIIDFQMKLSPEFGLSFLKLGEDFSDFGNVSKKITIGLDLQLNTMVGIIIYDALLLNIGYDIKPYISYDYLILNREFSLSASLYYWSSLNKSEDQFGITIFADYTSSTHNYCSQSMTDYRTSIGLKIYNMFYYSRWLVDAIYETRELIY